MIWRRPLGAALAAAAIVQTATAQAPARRQETRWIVDTWLTCVECSDGELDSLRSLALRLPSVVDTLRLDLFNGPSATGRALLTRQLEATWARLDSLARRDRSERPALPKPDFVARYLGNMVEIYQGRAALGLGGIGGSAARAVLDSALGTPPGTFSPGVLRQIRFARDSIRN